METIEAILKVQLDFCHSGWVNCGVGSCGGKKVLMREVRGKTGIFPLVYRLEGQLLGTEEPSREVNVGDGRETWGGGSAS